MEEILKIEPYADDNTLLNDWVEDNIRRMRWSLFKNQEKWIYMIGELGEGRFPQFKDYDSVVEEFNYAFNEAVSGLKSYLWEEFIAKTRLGNIDLGEDMEEELRFLWGDEYFEEWDAAAKREIVKEYRENLDEDVVNRIFDKGWGKGWRDEIE